MTLQPRLLCIDLQHSPCQRAAPEARAVFGARQLLSVARGCGWPIIHTRMRADAITLPGIGGRQAAVLRPLTSERVFFRNRRSSVDCPALIEQLEHWSQDTVYVAAFDPLALLALLVDRVDRGPAFVLVEDAIAIRSSVSGLTEPDPISSAIHALASRTTIAALVDAVGSRTGRCAG